MHNTKKLRSTMARWQEFIGQNPCLPGQSIEKEISSPPYIVYNIYSGFPCALSKINLYYANFPAVNGTYRNSLNHIDNN